MRQTYKIMATILLGGFLLTSCNDSFLDLNPKDKLTNESFWKTESDAQEFQNSIYRYLVQPENHTIMTDCYTDNAVPVHVGAEQGQLSAGTATSSCPHFRQLWTDAYSGIRRCLVFYQNIPNVQMDETARKRMTAEVKFLEAFFYSTLLKYMGGVPILDHPLGLNETIPARNTAEETYNYIIKLLDAAAPDLPMIRTGADRGKPSAGACYALKARVAFYQHQYDVAQEAAEKVMQSGSFHLYKNYGDLFQPAGENSDEIIFEREYMENAESSKQGSLIGLYFAPIILGGWEAVSPSQDIVDAYPCTDGKSITESPLYDPKNPFKNRDPRLAYSILWNGATIAGKTYRTNNLGDGNHTRTGYCMRKYINPDNDGINNYDWTNFIYIRYAEVLLTYAECRNELLSAPDQKVYDAVNAIRQRPSVDLPPLPAGLSKDEMRTAIRHERRLELAFEGIHLFDTRSYRTTEADVTKPVYGVRSDGTSFLVEKRKFNPDRDYLWAIPLVEIDLSKGTLKQNPNWD
ncbi:MAG TPA: RagB/SusD family nutrient uptake outer membrane protein [Prevotella sp.]|nr:RagB/SusD family nutrient uptake outer membrane protein [Prevotella sp.]